MHPLTRRTIAEARRRGHSLSFNEHLDAIVALELAARDSQGVSLQDEVDWLDRPVVVGAERAATLRPLSFAGRLWLEEIEAHGWFAEDPVCEALCIAWALAHSRSPEPVQAAGTTERQVRTTVEKWARSLDCSQQALLTAARRLMMPRRPLCEPEATPAAANGADGGQAADRSYVGMLISRLAHAFGQTQQFWLFAPWADVQAAIELLRQDAEAVAKAGGKTAARSPQDPCVLAFARWRKAQQRFFDSLGPCRPAEDGAQAPGKEEHRPEAIEQAAHEQQQHG